MPTRQALDLALRYNRSIARLEASIIERLNAALDRAYRDLERELRRTYPAIASNQSLFVTQRKTLILEQLGETLQVVRPDQAAFYQQTLQETLQTANGLGRTLADELVSATNPNQAVAALSNVQVEAAALQARDGAERLRRYSEEFRGRASAIVEQGLIQGWGPARVADLLRRELGTTKSKAETLARTEVLSALNDAAQQRYTESGLQYFQWLATPSEASCQYCINRNMQVFKLGTKIPAHPRCRCIPLPWDKRWQDIGLADEDFAREYRDRLINDAAKLGVKPSSGITPFEKYAGLTQAPKPFWSPVNSSANQPTPQPTSQIPPTQRSRPAGSRLPKSTVLSLNPRFNTQAFDAGLDQITTPGAVERVAQLRQFVRTQGIQVVFDDVTQPEKARLGLLDKTRYQGWKADTPKMYYLAQTFGGFTASIWSHVVVAVNHPEATVIPTGKFQVEDLNAIAQARLKQANSGAAWSIAVRDFKTMGTDTQTFLIAIHELGHQIHYAAGTPTLPAGVKSMTQYGAVNHREWFSEHYSLWLLDADAYQKADPAGAKFVESTVEKALKASRRLK